MRWMLIPLALAIGCSARRAPAPAVPGAGEAPGWADLIPGMELRLEAAYYRPGTTERVIANYLGTEAITFSVRDNGSLHAMPMESSVAARPPEQPAVDSLLPARQRRLRHHRLFFQVLFPGRGETRAAVLLSARSAEDLHRLTGALLANPERVCGAAGAPGCAVFPPAATASLVRTIEVDGKRRTVPWAPPRDR